MCPEFVYNSVRHRKQTESKSDLMNELRNKELEKVTGGADVKVRFILVLPDVGFSKMAAIAAVKEIKGIGLKETKELLVSVPVAFGEYNSEEKAIADKCRLESAGCTVEIK